MRGTPHYHILLSVRKDSVGNTDIESNIAETQKRVTDLVKNVVTANLVSPTEKAPYVFHNGLGSSLSFEEQKVVVRIKYIRLSCCA